MGKADSTDTFDPAGTALQTVRKVDGLAFNLKPFTPHSSPFYRLRFFIKLFFQIFLTGFLNYDLL